LAIHFHGNGTGFRKDHAVSGSIVTHCVRLGEQFRREAFQCGAFIGSEHDGTTLGGIAFENNRKVEAMVTIAADERWHETIDRRLVMGAVLHRASRKQSQMSVRLDLIVGDLRAEIAIEAALRRAFTVIGIFDTKLHGRAEVEPALTGCRNSILPMRRCARQGEKQEREQRCLH